MRLRNACRVALRRCAIACILFACSPHAYSGDTGSIAGRLVWEGPLPPVERLEKTDRISDGDWVFSAGAPVLSRFHVSEETRGVRGAVVQLVNLNGLPASRWSDSHAARSKFEKEFLRLNGMPFHEVDSLDDERVSDLVFPGNVVQLWKGRHIPSVIAIQEGQPLLLVNRDRIGYGANYFTSRGEFKSHLLRPNTVEAIVLPSERCTITCPIHPWMRLSVHVVPHQWFAVTDSDGQFLIEQLPVGRVTYSIQVDDCVLDPTTWKRGAREVAGDVVVEKNRSVRIPDVTLTAEPVEK